MKLRSGVAFLLMLCMILFSLGFGAYRGWSEERAQVDETYAGLQAMIRARVESAYNLLTVASRHMPETDETVMAVTQARKILEGKDPLAQKALANDSLTRNANELLKKLAALESVRQDSRDLMYVESYLPQMLSESEERTAGANYNIAAAEFNQQLQNSFSGFIARMLGIKPAEEFIAP